MNHQIDAEIIKRNDQDELFNIMVKKGIIDKSDILSKKQRLTKEAAKHAQLYRIKLLEVITAKAG